MQRSTEPAPDARGLDSLSTPSVEPPGVVRHPIDFGFPITAMTPVGGLASGLAGIVKEDTNFTNERVNHR
jgi:hypothetical protein